MKQIDFYKAKLNFETNSWDFVDQNTSPQNFRLHGRCAN